MQDAGPVACVCLCVRADGGRGHRVGAARGTPVDVMQALRSE
jgi:hypothetical protein